MSRQYTFTLLLLVVIILLAGLTTWFIIKDNQRANSDAGQLFSGDAAPTLVDEAGNVYDIAVADGTPQLVTTWATWVPEIGTHLQAIATATSAGADISVIAANRDESPERIAAFFARNQKPESIVFVSNPGDTLYGSLDAYAMPETVIFDGSGEIVWRHRGIVNESELRAALDSIDI